MSKIPFQAIDWSQVPGTTHDGTSGTAVWQTLQLGGLRVRIVTYSPGYEADHWCEKGHVVHCLEGAFVSELSTGEKVLLREGESYVVSDGMSTHRSVSETGARLLIVDGNFLSAEAP